MNAKELTALIVKEVTEATSNPEFGGGPADIIEPILTLYMEGIGPDRCAYNLIPPLTRESLDAFAATGRPPGSFTLAVLEHDLFEACHRADDNNRWVLPIIVAYVHNKLPIGSHGSPENVRDWQRQGGLEGHCTCNGAEIGNGHDESCPRAPMPDEGFSWARPSE